MGRKGTYLGGSTLIKVYHTAGNLKPAKPGALSNWVEQFEARKKAGNETQIASALLDAAVPEPLGSPTPGARKTKQGIRKNKAVNKPTRFRKPSVKARAKATKRFIQEFAQKGRLSQDE